MLNGPLVIAYDGSDNADHAIVVCGQLLGQGLTAEVVHAWEPGRNAEPDRVQADQIARRGIDLALAAGFIATGHARSGNRPAWATICDAAEMLGASMIVMGTRGLTGVRAAVGGSVSHNVTQHAPCPVLTVPLPKR